ncbi:MAG: NADH-quinone oxidoreductase subunit A [Chloroflexi bacterium]|nr:NADH-quinone oxidoreductase subunit A [Chloroflexota bacterium]
MALMTSFILSLVRVRPRKPTAAKVTTYECGMEPMGPSWIQFNFRYYFFALLFVVFDIETVFLYPWAVAFKQLALFGFIEMIIFILILLVAYVYAWKKKALEWK